MTAGKTPTVPIHCKSNYCTKYIISIFGYTNIVICPALVLPVDCNYFSSHQLSAYTYSRVEETHDRRMKDIQETIGISIPKCRQLSCTSSLTG